MTRRLPRAGGSSPERLRLAGKEPDAYRATTMFVHFRRGLHERLAQLSNRLDAETRSKVMVAVHARVPTVTPEEQRAS